MKVPDYSSPQAQPEELQGPFEATPEGVQAMPGIAAQAGAAGRELTQGGMGLDQMAAIQRQLDVKAKVTNFEDATNGIMYDPQSGVMSQRGQNAVDAAGGAKKAIGDMQQAIMDQLPDQASKDMFQQVSNARLTAATAQIDAHAGQQLKVAGQEQSTARATVAMNGAIASYNPMPGADNSSYRQNTTVQQIELEHQADNLGLTGDAKSQYVLHGADGRSGMMATYVGTFNHLMENNQTQGAQAYLQSVQDQLPPGVADKMRDALQVGASKDDALKTALQVKAQTSDIGEQEATLDQMFKAGTITSDVHNMALQQLRADNAQRRGEQGEQDRSVLGSVWAIKQQNPNATLTDLSAAQLAYVKQRGLGPQVDSILSHGPATDNPRLFLDQMDFAARNPAAFTQQDITQYKGQLSDAHYRELEAAYISINKQDVKGMETNKLVQQSMAMFRADIKNAGLNPNPAPGSSDAANLAQFEGAVHDRLTQELTANPTVKPERLREITLGMLKDQALSGTGWIWNTKKPVYQMTPEEKTQAWDVPDADKAQITAELQKRKLPVTDAAIQYWYKKKQGAL